MSEQIIAPIGSIITYRAPYDSNATYYYKNWVSMCCCVFEAQMDNFSGVPPLVIADDGTISLENKEYWKCIIDNVSLYNHTLSTNSIANRTSKIEKDDVERDKKIADLQALSVKMVVISQADYDALVAGGKVDENTYYNILEE